MANGQNELRLILRQITANLKASAERNPGAGVEHVDDINGLIRQAKSLFRSPAVQNMKEFSGPSTLGEVLIKVSILEGVVYADGAEGRR